MTQKSPDQLECRAYQEAGHAVMFFLIDKGYTQDHMPLGRENILPKFRLLSAQVQQINWGETTYSLGSLMTVPQVLLAGDWAERIKNQPQNHHLPVDSPRAALALNLITAYVQEYGGDEMPLAEGYKLAAEKFQQIANYVRASLLKHWQAVAALATALTQQLTLSQARVYEIIEENIPQEENEKARRFLETYNADDVIMKWLEEEESES